MGGKEGEEQLPYDVKNESEVHLVIKSALATSISQHEGKSPRQE
jgi:hypothetical protein